MADPGKPNGNHRSPVHALWMAATVVALDYATPAAVQFMALAVFPVAHAAWFGGRRWGVPMAIALPLCGLGVVLLKAPPWSVTVTLVNAAIRISILVLAVYLVDRLAMQRRRLRVLEGLLPICSHCKRIRTGDQEWQQLERYISTHSHAQFSHGICPHCVKAHYSDLAAS